MSGIKYEFRKPDVAFEEFISAAVGEGMPIQGFLESPVARALFYSGMSAASGSYEKLLDDCRGHATAVLVTLAAQFHREIVATAQIQYEGEFGYEIDSETLGAAPGSGTRRSGSGDTGPGSNGADRVPRRVEDGSVSDRARGADTGGGNSGSRSGVAENSGHDPSAEGGGGDSERRYANLAAGGLGDGEQTGNIVVDYWNLAGCHMLPVVEQRTEIGQLCEASFYMGASFLAGQVAQTLELDDVSVDELTRETFNMLTTMAIAAMEASGHMLVAKGGQNDRES